MYIFFKILREVILINSERGLMGQALFINWIVLTCFLILSSLVIDQLNKWMGLALCVTKSPESSLWWYDLVINPKTSFPVCIHIEFSFSVKIYGNLSNMVGGIFII